MLGSTASLALFVAAAIAIDFGVQGNVVLGYRALFALGAEQRSRLNGIYMTTFFLAGAMGSAVGAWAYAYGGWTLAAGNRRRAAARSAHLSGDRMRLARADERSPGAIRGAAAP